MKTEIRGTTLVRALERAKMPVGGFDHRRHIQAAFTWLTLHEFETAVSRAEAALEGLATRMGLSDRYHATITRAYMLLVSERMRRPNAPAEWPEFADAFPDLFEWNPGLIDRHYSRERRDSATARATFVEPDLAPLPEAPFDGSPT